MRFQSSKLETETQSMERLCREVAAFANTDGGVIRVVGENPSKRASFIEEIKTRVVSDIRPDVSSVIHLFGEQDGSVVIEVNQGNRKPYYLKSKGMRPIGVFLHARDSAVCAGPRQIAEMIRDTCGDVFEERRSLKQNLTFSQAELTFARNHIELSPQRYQELGIVDPEDGEFTNLGLILSDQCDHSVRINVYTGGVSREQKDCLEIGGSVCRQYDEASAFLMKHVRGRSLSREGAGVYPEEAIREALLNALEHRDYDFTGSTIINVGDDEMEFISMGGLLSDLSVEDICSGVSESRNRRLAQIFRRMAVTSSSSVGIRRVFLIYRSENSAPRIEVTENSFRFTLPRLSGAGSESGTDGWTNRGRRGAINRHERQSDMIMQEIQQLLQRQTAQQMSSVQVRVDGKGGMISYRKGRG